MSPDPDPQDYAPRNLRKKLVLPLAMLTGALALFLVLFWDGTGRGGRHHGGKWRPAQADESRNSAGSHGHRRNSDGFDSRNGGSLSRSAGSPGSGKDTWWYQNEGTREETRNRKKTDDAWWAPGKEAPSKPKAPSSANRSSQSRPDPDRSESVNADEPTKPSSMNPGEAAGQVGPDDYWWRK